MALGSRERVHGFTEGGVSQPCECFGDIQILEGDTFPDNESRGKLFKHAKEGWVLFREMQRLIEAMHKIAGHGEWKMLASSRGMDVTNHSTS